MKAALVNEWGTIPKFQDVDSPPPPTTDQVQIKVLAVGAHRLVRTRTTGKHFSATKLPHLPGSDGIGRTVSDGKLVYFTTFWEAGSYAEVVNVAKSQVTPVPEDADPVQLAGLVNPALSSWMALTSRTTNLPEKFSVLIIGATTTSGKVALQLARILGAGQIIGAARNPRAVESHGFDELITLENDPATTDYSKAEDVDVVLDYIYGPTTLQLFRALKPTTPVQYVHIGAMSTPTLTLPGDVLRSKDITVRGSAPGSFTMKALAQEMPKMLAAVKNLPKQDFRIVPLEDIESAWPDEKNRIVFTVQEGFRGR